LNVVGHRKNGDGLATRKGQYCFSEPPHGVKRIKRIGKKQNLEARKKTAEVTWNMPPRTMTSPERGKRKATAGHQ